MKRAGITHVFASIRATARMLMREQELSIAHSAMVSDLRSLPEHLRRDIGLVDGNIVVEGVPVRQERDTKARDRWSDLVVTPHAA